MSVIRDNSYLMIKQSHAVMSDLEDENNCVSKSIYVLYDRTRLEYM